MLEIDHMIPVKYSPVFTVQYLCQFQMYGVNLKPSGASRPKFHSRNYLKHSFFSPQFECIQIACLYGF